MYTTGQKPGKGMYQCMKCGELIELKDDAEALANCPRCGHNMFRKA